MTISSSPSLETVLVTALRRLLQWGIPMAAAALVFGAPSPDNGLYSYTLAHLVVLQVAAFATTIELAPLIDTPWFARLRRPWLASAASVVAAVVGFSALLTLASSAAARYDPSLQFLQLLSSLDIAWVVSALYLGVRHLRGRPFAAVAGSLLLAACVASIAVYLDAVGFTDAGGWLLDGNALSRIVIPADTVSAVLAIAALLVASRKADQRTVQPRPQS